MNFLNKCLQNQSQKRATFDDLLQHEFLRESAFLGTVDYFRAGLDLAESVILNTKKSFYMPNLCDVIEKRYELLPAHSPHDGSEINAQKQIDHFRAPSVN